VEEADEEARVVKDVPERKKDTNSVHSFSTREFCVGK